MAGWSLQIFLFSGAASRAKFETNLLRTLPSPRNDSSYVRLIGACNPRIAFVAYEAIFRRLERTKCPK